MTYQQVLDYLFAQLPMFHRVGKAAYKADLSNTLALCRYLGNPQDKLKVVHVAGTNGKGSTSHWLASILQSSGYKVGLYTSPHLIDFRERIRLNGVMIPEEDVVRFVEVHKDAVSSIAPSFFEWTYALCLSWMAEQKPDVLVLETGLGGRLDSTNVSNPILSIITNVGWDHMDLLGNTLESIAMEKAGIIKPGVPVVLGETSSSALSVFKNAAENSFSRLHYAPACWQVGSWKAAEVSARSRDGMELQGIASGLHGWYQSENLATVLCAVDELRALGYRIDEGQLRMGLAQVKERTGLRGRWDVLCSRPLVVADTAHNQPGFEATMKQFQETHARRKRMVLGFVRDKAVEKLLELLPQGVELFLAPPSVPRALDLDGLKAIPNLPAGTLFFERVDQAVRAALEGMTEDDALYIGGSTFVVADALPMFLKGMNHEI